MAAELTRAADNRSTLRRLALFAVVMFGFGFAMVPFYRAICEAIGLNSLVARDAAPANTQVDTSRWVTVQLDANARGLPWHFAPDTRSVKVHPGELVHVTYELRNESPRPLVGQAIPSYGPKDAAGHFRKMECFCFQKQELAPGEIRRMPVVFAIDAALPKEVATVTLSYTFFEVNAATPRPSSSKAAG